MCETFCLVFQSPQGVVVLMRQNNFRHKKLKESASATFEVCFIVATKLLYNLMLFVPFLSLSRPPCIVV